MGRSGSRAARCRGLSSAVLPAVVRRRRGPSWHRDVRARFAHALSRPGALRGQHRGRRADSWCAESASTISAGRRRRPLTGPGPVARAAHRRHQLTVPRIGQGWGAVQGAQTTGRAVMIAPVSALSDAVLPSIRTRADLHRLRAGRPRCRHASGSRSARAPRSR